MSHNAQLNELKAAIRERLAELDCVIGWEQGFDVLHATPLFIRCEQDVDRLLLGPLTVHNPASYLTGLRGKKVGVIVKGCDGRSVSQLLGEKLIDRENLTIFAIDCQGVVSQRKLGEALAEGPGLVESIDFSENGCAVRFADGELAVERQAILADKCLSCRSRKAPVADMVFGGEEKEGEEVSPLAAQLAFAEKPAAEKLAFWQEQMARCIRCYACRNACPMCVCKDYCIAESREPLWLQQENSPAENFMFQLIHVSHLAGRCTECGECERACPVDIPLMLLRRHMNSQIAEVFDHHAGMDPQKTSPLLTFQMEEERIKEREW